MSPTCSERKIHPSVANPPSVRRTWSSMWRDSLGGFAIEYVRVCTSSDSRAPGTDAGTSMETYWPGLKAMSASSSIRSRRVSRAMSVSSVTVPVKSETGW